VRSVAPDGTDAPTVRSTSLRTLRPRAPITLQITALVPGSDSGSPESGSDWGSGSGSPESGSESGSPESGSGSGSPESGSGSLESGSPESGSGVAAGGCPVGSVIVARSGSRPPSPKSRARPAPRSKAATRSGS